MTDQILHAPAEAWRPIQSAPMDGTKVRLGHEQDASSMKLDSIFRTFGSFNGRSWDLSAYFIIPGGPHGLMSSAPTHWMPIAAAPKIQHSEGEGR